MTIRTANSAADHVTSRDGNSASRPRFPRSIEELDAILSEHNSPLAEVLSEAVAEAAKAPSRFVVFDCETSGLSAHWDQILQFAAIRTNERFEVEYPERDIVNLSCRPRQEVVPHLLALLATRTFPAAVVAAPLSHHEMMQQVEAFLVDSAPAVFVGHNVLGFDSEHLRHNLFASLLPPYALHSAGNRILDTMLLARLILTLDPAALNWPHNAKGAVSFRLGDLCSANGISLPDDEAHDALADTRATLALLAKMKSASPIAFAFGLALSDKRFVREILEQHPVLGLIGKWGEPKIDPIGFVAEDATNRNAVLVAKLAAENAERMTWPGFDMATALAGRERVITRVKCNAMPLILPCDLDDPLLPIGRVNLRALDHSAANDTLQFRAVPFRIDAGLHREIHQAAANVAAARPTSDYIEERLYADGFASEADFRACREMLKADPADKAGFLSRIVDERLRTFALRHVFEVAPQTLTRSQRALTQEWLRLRLMSETPRPWMTIAKAFEEIEGFLEVIPLVASNEATELFPDPAPVEPDDTGALIANEPGEHEVAALRREHIDRSVGTELAILNAYWVWLSDRHKMLRAEAAPSGDGARHGEDRSGGVWSGDGAGSGDGAVESAAAPY